VKRFDQVIFAVNAPQVFKLLKNKTPEESQILSKFGVSKNRAILHSDQNLMPRMQKVWSSWNFISEGKNEWQTKEMMACFIELNSQYLLASSRSDLALQLFDVSGELSTVALEEQVVVGEPSGVSESNELEGLWEQWDGVDGANERVGEGEGDNGTSGVKKELWLVLHLFPLLGDSGNDLVRVNLVPGTCDHGRRAKSVLVQSPCGCGGACTSVIAHGPPDGRSSCSDAGSTFVAHDLDVRSQHFVSESTVVLGSLSTQHNYGATSSSVTGNSDN
jgi:hypothetical protein